MPNFEVTATFEDCSVHYETEKAILVLIPESGAVKKWVPKSLIDEESEVQRRQDTGALIVARWWAVQENLIEE